MTTNADTVLSSVRKRTSSFMMALALLAVWSPSWAAESGQASGPAPGGLAVPPLTGEQTTPSAALPEGQTTPSAPQTAQEQTPPRTPGKDAPREDIVSGTGQAFGGYSGTWHDPTRDETVTTIIAPRQPMMQQPPMYIAPQIYPNMDGSWTQGGGQYYYPQQYPGYTRPARPHRWDQDRRPHRPPHWNQGQRPSRPPYWDQNQRPQRPPSWDQGQRPPYWNPGQQPPSWDQGQRPPYWNPGQQPPSWNQGQRPPYWNPGQRPPSWNQGQRPPQGGGIPPSWWRGSGR